METGFFYMHKMARSLLCCFPFIAKTKEKNNKKLTD